PVSPGPQRADRTPTLNALTARQLLDILRGATAFLQRHIDALNAINVFPVPDGDTGTNLYLTMRAALAEAEQAPSDAVGETLEALARGALMGARGNSGVILSQILRGFARAASSRDTLDAETLAAALELGARYAYEAVSAPREGTMLTVVREAAGAARRHAADDPEAALEATVRAAAEAVERTPELLPALKEAGVVDAGGKGLSVLLDGALRALRGEPLPDEPALPEADASHVAAAALLARQHDGHPVGYCVEFLVRGQGLDRARLERELNAVGESVLVVGNHDLLRVHVHASEPERALAFGRALGDVTDVKVDDMDAQLHRFVEGERAETAETGVAIVAVARGAGLEEALRSVGVRRVVPGGPTMNPSTREVLEAIESCPEDRVFVLPDNKNVELVARQAAAQSSKRVHIIPTRSVPEGIAAAMALDPDADDETNARRMAEAAASVRWAEVTLAARETSHRGRRIRAGQPIALVQGELTVVADSVEDAVFEAVRQMATQDATLLTLFAGEGVSDEEARSLAERLGERYPQLEVEVVRGDQPHYPYILSME
ncbi:MAG TPA: DAK2 domain-containing protein, partial [Dehalococcoidia bacterium]|nr:DAK2 domain-containing protein [Dehalococcoidia bacterium]